MLIIVVAINVGQLDAAFDDGAEVTPDTLRAMNLVKGSYDVLKVLGNGELTKKLKISAHRFSKSALEKIQSRGGEASVRRGSLAAPVGHGARG